MLNIEVLRTIVIIILVFMVLYLFYDRHQMKISGGYIGMNNAPDVCELFKLIATTEGIAIYDFIELLETLKCLCYTFRPNTYDLINLFKVILEKICVSTENENISEIGICFSKIETILTLYPSVAHEIAEAKCEDLITYASQFIPKAGDVSLQIDNMNCIPILHGVLGILYAGRKTDDVNNFIYSKLMPSLNYSVEKLTWIVGSKEAICNEFDNFINSMNSRIGSIYNDIMIKYSNVKFHDTESAEPKIVAYLQCYLLKQKEWASESDLAKIYESIASDYGLAFSNGYKGVREYLSGLGYTDDITVEEVCITTALVTYAEQDESDIVDYIANDNDNLVTTIQYIKRLTNMNMLTCQNYEEYIIKYIIMTMYIVSLMYILNGLVDMSEDRLNVFEMLDIILNNTVINWNLLSITNPNLVVNFDSNYIIDNVISSTQSYVRSISSLTSFITEDDDNDELVAASTPPPEDDGDFLS